jgi:hypothetical protein
VDIKCASYHVFYPAIAPMQTFCLPHYAAEADVVISIPVLKTHMECLVVLGIKNLFGLGSPTIYDAPRHKLHQGFWYGQQLHQIIVDIAQALRPDLTIMDASIGLEGNGPHHVNEGAYTVDVRDRLGHWLVLASTDIVALDATSTRVMGLEPARSEHLVLAHEQGLGEGREEYIEIVGTPLSEVQMDWLGPVKGIQYERPQVGVPVPAVPEVQRGPIVRADQAVGAWKTGYLHWARASVAYLDTPYTDPTPPQGSERTSAVGFHVDRESTYIIFGRALVDLSTQTAPPSDWIASMVRNAEGVKQWEMIYQRDAPCHTRHGIGTATGCIT